MASSSPSPQQQFCLRWNNHQSALVSVFDHLLQSEAFVDVTLAVEGLLLRAHKLVLSACSPYFQAMFASHPAKHPIIILKDVRYGDLRALLDFMYKGEVAVDQDRLPAFLRLAESLKIRGLAEFCEESLSHQAESSSSQPPIFDSLLDSQKRSHHPPSSSTGQTIHHQSAAAVAQQQQHNNQTPPAGIELLPLSSQQQQQRQTAGLDFSVPTGLGLFHGSPLALAAAAAAAAAAVNSNNTPRSSSSLSSSTKRPSSPQTYAHHRRKRGRPPRQSYSESAGNLLMNTGLIAANKSNSSKDVRGSSPEVMEMNVDLLSMGSADAASSAPTNASSAHDSSASSKNHENNREGTSPSPRSNSSPHLTNNATATTTTTTNSALIKRETPSLLLIEPDTRPDQHHVAMGSDPQPGTSHQQMDFDISRRGGKSAGIKTMKRARGRPRGFGRNASSLDRASMLGGAGADSLVLDDSSLAGPSSVQRDGSTPDRTLLGNSSGSNSNNTEQLQEMSIRGLNLFRYASVSEEGMYRCIPCEKEHVTRTFKNKYSFQRHAYLYHEGNQRKVFPCLVCGREFSRPDKLKHHLKSVHDYAVSREYSNAYYALP